MSKSDTMPNNKPSVRKAGETRGRKPWREVLKLKAVGKLSAEVLLKALADPSIPLVDRARMATVVFSKYIPRDVQVSEQSQHTIIHINKPDDVHTTPVIAIANEAS